jgi:hypothetical protein
VRSDHAAIYPTVPQDNDLIVEVFIGGRKPRQEPSAAADWSTKPIAPTEAADWGHLQYLLQETDVLPAGKV